MDAGTLLTRPSTTYTIALATRASLTFSSSPMPLKTQAVQDPLVKTIKILN